MGLPTNQTKGQGCSPVSSNCVIWQGPDIPCINLCHGDSVTDVVFKLATELCDIMDTLDIKTYDLTCFQPICPDPQNFHDMLQFLITKICELQCCCDGTKPAQSDCPDACIVTVAPCFYFYNQLGDQITTMTLPEYVIAIGNKICQNAGQIALNDQRIGAVLTEQATQQAEIVALRAGIDSITIEIPSSCLMGSGPFPIQDVVTNLETEFCNQRSAEGTPIELLTAIQAQCANLANSKQLTNRSSNMGSIPGWIIDYSTVADSLNNLWLTVCDIRSAVDNILRTCCCTDCDDVLITFTAAMNGDNIILYFNGSVPSGLTDCFPDGCFVTFTDGNGGTYSTYVEVVNNLGGSVNINLQSTPVNTSTNITVTIQGCWNRPTAGADCGGLRCERVLTYTIVNTAPCPEVTLSPITTTEVTYTFLNTLASPITYVVEIYTTPANMIVSSQSTVNPGVGVIVQGTFTGLLSGTNYYVVVKCNINGNITSCPLAFITTLVQPCLAPTSVSASKIAP